MNASNAPHAAEQLPPFLSHPFGGLTRGDGGELFPILTEASLQADRVVALPATADDFGGFDFHLGVYARF